MVNRLVAPRLVACYLACWLPAIGAAGCSAAGHGQLDQRAPAPDADGAPPGTDGAPPGTDGAPAKAVRIEATLDPQTASADDPLRLGVLVFGFRIVALDTPPRSGQGHYLVSLLAHGGETALFESALREQTFRLSDHADRRLPGPGDHAVTISLRSSDGRAVLPEATVQLPLTVVE